MFNIILPPDVIKPYFELRERFERRVDRDFNKGAKDNRSDLLSRYRLGANLKLSSQWLGEVQYQYSHDLFWTPQRNQSAENRDLGIGYIRYKSDGYTVTAGRERFALGEQRLISPTEFPNLQRSFDGARVQWHNWEAFGYAISVVRVPDARLGGLVNRHPTGETSLLYKHDHPANGEVGIFTLDERDSAKFGGWTVSAELALQTGHAAGKKDEAYAAHLRVDREVGQGYKLFGEGNFASGGSSSNVVRTFDNLYPSNHDKYGLLDLQAWKNMRQLELGIEGTPLKNLSAKLEWSHFWLDDPKDAWYTGNGVPNRSAQGAFVDPTGNSGRDLGQEIDLSCAWTLKNNATLSAGIGLFDPGHFVKSVGGANDRQAYGYLQFQKRF